MRSSHRRLEGSTRSRVVRILCIGVVGEGEPRTRERGEGRCRGGHGGTALRAPPTLPTNKCCLWSKDSSSFDEQTADDNRVNTRSVFETRMVDIPWSRS